LETKEKFDPSPGKISNLLNALGLRKKTMKFGRYDIYETGVPTGLKHLCSRSCVENSLSPSSG